MLNIHDNLIKSDLRIIGVDAFAVLNVIASHLGKNKTAFPGIKTMMHMTGMGRNRVYKSISILIENRFLQRVQENKKGQFGKTLYKVTTNKIKVYIPASKLNLQTDLPLPEIQNTLPENGDTEIQDTLIYKEGSINKKENKYILSVDGLTYSLTDDQLFEIFWNTFELKIGRGKAIRKWKQLPAEDKINAIQKVPAYKKYLERNQWCNQMHPNTWLNQRRWEDDFSVSRKHTGVVL